MRKLVLLLLIGLMVAVGGPAGAVETGDEPLLFQAALLPGEAAGEVPWRGHDFGLRADTTWYGRYTEIGGEYYAIGFDVKEEGSWTFDRGAGPPPTAAAPQGRIIPDGEGWSVIDLTANETTYWKVIDGSLNLGAGVPAPIISGNYSLWCGADDDESNDLCWECDAGYGNKWCQRVYGEVLDYNGSGGVTLQCKYFSQSEACFDGTQVYLRRADNSELMLNPFPPETCEENLTYEGGDWTDSIGHYTNPVTYARTITQFEIDDSPTVQIIFEFTADGGWSDQDCDYTTIWGPVGIDDVTITGGGIDESYNFESGGFQGWTPDICTPIGDYVDIVDMDDCYTVLDPCVCGLQDNILEMHDALCDEGVHPVGQHVRCISPICWFGNTDLKTIFMEFDMYAEMPLVNGVLHRPGWSYYPYVCEETGAIDWSPRVGQASWNYVGDNPVCGTWRYGGTEIDQGVPVPADAEGVVAYLELLSSCEEFGIENCSHVTNFTPIYDNITVGVTAGIVAPIVRYDVGARYHDVGSFPSILFDPMAPGPANITLDCNMDTPPGYAADHCGDSLVVSGPQPGDDPNRRWNAKLWWRVRKRAPFQSDYANGIETAYKIWRDRVSDGKEIDRPDSPEFAWGLMDTVQIGFVVSRNKFKSEFHEHDDDFVGEGADENEMIWDNMLYPGTQIEFFVTAYYTVTPDNMYYLPDTTGQYFDEFEILPGLRTANLDECGGDGNHEYCVFQPALLYIDAYNRGGQVYIENALRTILNGEDLCLADEGCEIPKYRNWDRYDYLDASSSWNAPFVRGAYPGSNNGMTLDQIIGYRAILLSTGTLLGGCMQDEDFGLFAQWLTTSRCNGNVNRQFFHMNGDKAAEVLEDPGGYPDDQGPAFLSNYLCAALYCNAFHGYTQDPNCAPESEHYCVDWEWTGDPGGFPEILDVTLWGSYCPNLYGFNVLEPIGDGFCNRADNANLDPSLPPKYMECGQVLREDLSPGANYRTVLDGASWHHMTLKDPDGGSPTGYCPRSTREIVAAAVSEIGAALLWGFSAVPGNDPGEYGFDKFPLLPSLTNTEDLATCQGTWDLPVGVDEDGLARQVNRLYQNRPNPFNPTTEIHFSLAQAGAVEISIYDVKGRLVKTLVDGRKDAGVHSVVWNGTNNLGNKVGSGVYWSKMKTEKYVSNKQMMILK